MYVNTVIKIICQECWRFGWGGVVRRSVGSLQTSFSQLDWVIQLYILHRSYLPPVRLSRFKPNHSPLCPICSNVSGMFYLQLWAFPMMPQGYWLFIASKQIELTCFQAFSPTMLDSWLLHVNASPPQLIYTVAAEAVLLNIKRSGINGQYIQKPASYLLCHLNVYTSWGDSFSHLRPPNHWSFFGGGDALW